MMIITSLEFSKQSKPIEFLTFMWKIKKGMCEKSYKKVGILNCNRTQSSKKYKFDKSYKKFWLSKYGHKTSKYDITPEQYNIAKEYGYIIRPSNNPNKKIDVLIEYYDYDDNTKYNVFSIGDINDNDYWTLLKNGKNINDIKLEKQNYKNDDTISKLEDIFLWNCGLIYYLDDEIMNNTEAYCEFLDYYNHPKHFQHYEYEY